MDRTKASKPRSKTSKPTVETVSVVAVEPSPTVAEVVDPQEWVNRRATAQATRAANARQASGRRRFVDPTTCEREYSVAEMEFMQAMHDYKHSSGRMFPTWSEVLEVLKKLGYEKPNRPASAAVLPAGAKAVQTA